MKCLLGKAVKATVLGKPELDHISVVNKTTNQLRSEEKKTIAKSFNKSNSRLFFIEQVHQSRAIFVENNESSCSELQINPQADAVFTMDRGLKLIIRTADCLPFFFVLESTLSDSILAGIIHAGWRGMSLQIIEKTLQQAESIWQKKANCPIDNIIFAIGPAIGKNNYEVGLDVSIHFNHIKKVPNKPGKFLLDLSAEAKEQLNRFADPKKYNIMEKHDLCGCTRQKNEYYSHRSGDKLRNQNIIEIVQ